MGNETKTKYIDIYHQQIKRLSGQVPIAARLLNPQYRGSALFFNLYTTSLLKMSDLQAHNTFVELLKKSSITQRFGTSIPLLKMVDWRFLRKCPPHFGCSGFIGQG